MTECLVCGGDILDVSSFCHKCGASTSGDLTGKLNPDSILEGRYIIVKTLGRGGMGAVYMALDQRLDNVPVAIKEMSSNAVGGNLQAAISAFKKEASMLTRLRHPALPRISDFFARGEDRWYLVMDYIKGQTLKEIMEKRGPISEDEVLDWARQLCQILIYLHTQDPPIIFRDLKPTNIMLTPDGQIKLIDFGIARHFRQGNTADTSAYGSHGFAPPEQYGQNQTDERSDIYALGATLHYLLTGLDPIQNPFIFESPSKLVKVHPQLDEAIMKAVALKAGNRPQSIGKLMNLLPQTGHSAPERVVNETVSSSKDTIKVPAIIVTAPSEKLKPDGSTTDLIAAEAVHTDSFVGSGDDIMGTQTISMGTPGLQVSTFNPNPPTATLMMGGKAPQEAPASTKPVINSYRSTAGNKSRKVILAACLAAALIGAGIYGFNRNNITGSKSVQVASNGSSTGGTNQANDTSSSTTASSNTVTSNQDAVDKSNDVTKDEQTQTTQGSSQPNQSSTSTQTPAQGSQTTPAYSSQSSTSSNVNKESSNDKQEYYVSAHGQNPTPSVLAGSQVNCVVIIDASPRALVAGRTITLTVPSGFQVYGAFAMVLGGDMVCQLEEAGGRTIVVRVVSSNSAASSLEVNFNLGVPAGAPEGDVTAYIGGSAGAATGSIDIATVCTQCN